MSSSERVSSQVSTLFSGAASGAIDVTSQAGITAVSLLTHSPGMLHSIGTHELARFVSQPEATAPLFTGAATSGQSARVAGAGESFAAAAVAAAAANPAGDLVAALQSALGRIQDAFVGAPNELLKALGLALGGDVRTSLQTLTSLVIGPILSIGLLDLPNITAASAQLLPPLAPVFNALPDIAINVGLPIAQFILNVQSGIADSYEGVRDGLQKADLGAAISSLVANLGNLIQNGVTDVFGENGIVPALFNAGRDLLTAVGKIGAPAAVAAATTGVEARSVAATATPAVGANAGTVEATPAKTSEKTGAASESTTGDTVTASNSTTSTASSNAAAGSDETSSSSTDESTTSTAESTAGDDAADSSSADPRPVKSTGADTGKTDKGGADKGRADTDKAAAAGTKTDTASTKADKADKADKDSGDTSKSSSTAKSGKSSHKDSAAKSNSNDE